MGALVRPEKSPPSSLRGLFALERVHVMPTSWFLFWGVMALTWWPSCDG